MKAIMLCGGLGTRSYPFTHLYPKMTQQVCGIPIIEYMLSWFNGTPEVDHLYISLRKDTDIHILEEYLELRKNYVGAIDELFLSLGYHNMNCNPDLKVSVLRSDGWGTGGDLRTAIRNVEYDNGGLDKEILVCNGDYVTVLQGTDGVLTTQLNLSEIIQNHRSANAHLGAVLTDALTPVSRRSATRFGVADVVDRKGFHIVQNFMEKPALEDVPDNPCINAGVYILESEFILSNINRLLPDKPNTSLEKTLLEIAAKDESILMNASILDLYGWFDVGTLQQLIQTSISIALKAPTKI